MEWLDHKNIGCNVFVITDVETVADAVTSFRAGTSHSINSTALPSASLKSQITISPVLNFVSSSLAEQIRKV